MNEAMRLVREGKVISHESFVIIERMSETEIKEYVSAPLSIKYSFCTSPFGEVLIGSTAKGICYLGFLTGSREESLKDLQARYPHSVIEEGFDEFQKRALAAFSVENHPGELIHLHLRGTDFQVKVWQALLNIPVGALTTYGDLAGYLGCRGASRAVGTAIGSNPVAFLIPCHRVVRATGGLGGFRWGLPCKTKMIEWEHSNS